MKISYNWLKEFINIDLTPPQLSSLLTDCGLEVEGTEAFSSIKGGLAGVIIGEVVHKEKHPDADKLSLTKVDIGGKELLSIVCGAPNVEAGQKVLVATVGTEIFTDEGSFTIKKAKIRGAVSEGMICAEDELGLGSSHEGIMVLPDDAKKGMSASAYYKIEKDWVFEIGLTPNRADATSHLGVARDVWAVLKTALLPPEQKNNKKLEFNFQRENSLETTITERPINISVENPEACPRYAGLSVKNIIVEESPEWLKNKLKAIGLKPINNIVDISNFILFDLGQPLHIFDADKVAGQKIIVKKYDKAFKFQTLDGETHDMTSDDLMICNSEEPMCIAGIYGGINSGVTTDTKNIFIESAYFDAVTIRKTAKRLGLKTDSSFRFERGADPDMTLTALIKAAGMICKLAGGTIASPIIDNYPQKITPFKVDFCYDNYYKLSGSTITKNKIKDILTALEIEIKEEKDNCLSLSVPPYRVDVTREVDVIEEIMRIFGFNNIEIPEKLNTSSSHFGSKGFETIANNIAQFLSHRGYYEMMNNSLTKTDYYKELDFFDAVKSVPILNPLSKDLAFLRQTLLYSGLEVIAYNMNRTLTDMKLFETGKVYQLNKALQGLDKYLENYYTALFLTGKPYNETWKQNNETFDFYQLKAEVNLVLKRLGLSSNKINVSESDDSIFEYGLKYDIDEKPLIQLGEVNKKIQQYFDIKQEVFYAEFNGTALMEALKHMPFQYEEPSKYPKMRRDLALLLDARTTFAEVEKLALSQNFKQLIDIGLFDIYKGKNIESGKKSYAVNFTFQDANKTLTDREVDSMMTKLINLYKKNLKAIIR